SSRWHLRERLRTSGLVHVGVEWTTASGDVNDTMGFAPLFTMPVPRRAQYAAIGLWPGAHGNPFRGTSPTPRATPGRVNFLDVPHEFDPSTYDNMWRNTESAVAELMMLPADRASAYRQVAFVLSTSAAAALQLDR
ncbi:MAG TPA: hypothetical protein VLX92_15200, partial [Kofleriaceae bacterium]|nr:hypothetical protein [Kofleriaceae bacterium]